MDAFFENLEDSSIKLCVDKIVPMNIDSKAIQEEALYISYICTISRKKEYDDKLFHFRKKALSGELSQEDYVELNEELEKFKEGTNLRSGRSLVDNRKQRFKIYAKIRSFSLLVSQVLFVDNLLKEKLWSKLEHSSKMETMKKLSEFIREFSNEKIRPGEVSLDEIEVKFYAILFTLQAGFDEMFVPDEDVVQYKKRYGVYTGKYKVTDSYDKATLFLKLVNKQVITASDAAKKLCYNITTRWGEEIDEDTWNDLNQYYYEEKSFLTGGKNFFATNYEKMLERFLPQFPLSKVKCAEEILTREYKKHNLKTLNIVEIGAGSGSFAIDLVMACKRLDIDTTNVCYLGLEPNKQMRNKLEEHLRQKIEISRLPSGWKVSEGSLESFLKTPQSYLCSKDNTVIVFCYSAHHCYYKNLQAFFNSKIIMQNAGCIYVLDVVEEHGWTKPYYTWVDCESPENFDNVVQRGKWNSRTLWQEPNSPIEGYAITDAWCNLRKLTVSHFERKLKVKETYIPLNSGETLFLRHNEVCEGKKTLLFIHGLGESSLCFQEAFDDPRFEAFNLLVPDLLGYGKSSQASDYKFDLQLNRLKQLIEFIEAKIPIKELFLIGHSLGGDLATLFCHKYINEIPIIKFINIEGDITPNELFISSRANDVYLGGGESQFVTWFESFVNNDVYYDFADQYGESIRRYYASLRFCDPKAFIQNAIELCERNRDYKHKKFKSEIGCKYVAISKKIQTIFCYGTNSLKCQTICFLRDLEIKSVAFEGAGHWVMIDKKEEFYKFLYNFVK